MVLRNGAVMGATAHVSRLSSCQKPTPTLSRTSKQRQEHGDRAVCPHHSAAQPFCITSEVFRGQQLHCESISHCGVLPC